MVIRREDNDISEPKNLGRGDGPREDLWLCLLQSMWTDSVIFQRGSNEGILGMTDRIFQGSSGAKPL